MRVVDLFAGVGWAEGLAPLGIDEVGLELAPSVCATRAAAGHATVQADVTCYPAERFAGWDGVIASPPCPDWSTAGPMTRRAGKTGGLVDEVPRWVETVKPTWVVCEQVPQVLDVWREHAVGYRRLGYRTWVGILDAASFGVPQNRLRAFLLAHREHDPHPPEPTHGRSGLFGPLEPFVPLATTVGLEPGWWYDSGQNSRTAGGGLERYRRSCDRPAGTLTTKCVSQWVLHKGADRRKLSMSDALAVQGFRRDLPLQGGVADRHRLIGNAVPPPLAAAVVGAVTRLELERAA